MIARASKKNDLEEAWLAQQDLLAERRQKAAEQQVGIVTPRYVPRQRNAKSVEQPRVEQPRVATRVAKSEPKLAIEDDDAEDDSGSGNPLGGFLGKLFKKK